MRNFNFLFLILWLFACHNKKEVGLEEKSFSYSSFERTVHLSSRKFVFDSILQPNKIHLKKGILIVSNLSGPRLIHLIKADSMKYLNGKGIEGSGPGEILGGNIREFDPGLDPTTFWAYDLNSKRNYRFNLFDNEVLSNRVIIQKDDFFYGFSMHWRAEDEIVSYLSHDNYKFGIFDSTGQSLTKVRPWSSEKEVEAVEGYVLSDLYQGPIDFNHNNNLLVHASVRHETFEIINLNLENPNSILITGPTGDPFEYEIEASGNQIGANISPNVKLGYNDVFIGEEAIFLVYIGQTPEELSRLGGLSTVLFEFDLNGKPVAQYKLDRNIKSIVVDELGRKIYATTEDQDPGIAVFDY